MGRDMQYAEMESDAWRFFPLISVEICFLVNLESHLEMVPDLQETAGKGQEQEVVTLNEAITVDFNRRGWSLTVDSLQPAPPFFPGHTIFS